MGADGEDRRLAGRAGTWNGIWAGVWAVALIGVFTGLARLFMLWDLHTRADSGLSRVQGLAWMYLALAGIVGFGLLAASPGLSPRGVRTAGVAAGVLYAGTVTLAYGWSARAADEILRDRGVAHPAVVTAVRTRGNPDTGEVHLADVRLEDGRNLTLAASPSLFRGAEWAREHPVGSTAQVTLDPEGVAQPRFGPPPTGAAVGWPAAGAGALAAASLAAALPLGTRTATRRARRVRQSEPRDAAPHGRGLPDGPGAAGT
ncbi:hypothetical protein ACFV6G_11685 [Streptomyces lavendulae]|uniref:hypothetical protein n=1 Tax=Streptomyces lavendulae TaxID=1914 RepID=UPI0036A26CC4